jgi:hypothetical protein
MFMDDNARPHRAWMYKIFYSKRLFRQFHGLRCRQTWTYRACMDFIGRKINQRNPKCQNIDELRTAILQEWQQFPQEWLRRLVQSMTRRVTEVHNKRGGYTRYCFLCLTHMHNRCI